MAAQLYVAPGASGEASYIAAIKVGLNPQQLAVHLVDWETKNIFSGPNKSRKLADINPKGNEPALILEDGTLLDEDASILQWIAAQDPSAGLAPVWGSNDFYLLQCKLNFIASEIHTFCSFLYENRAELDDSERKNIMAKLKTKLDFLESQELQGDKKFLTGNECTIADIYLFVILSWLESIDLDIAAHPKLKAFCDNLQSMDFVKKARESLASMEADNK